MPKKLLLIIFILFALGFAMDAKAGIIIRPVHNFGLVGYWDFQEGAGNYAYDKSGQGNTGTWYGAGSHWADGKIGKGGYFNFSDDYVDLGINSYNLGIRQNATYCVWANIDTSKGNSDWISDYTDAGTNGMNLRAWTTNLVFYVYPNNHRENVTGILTNGWHFACGVMDGSQMKTYLDGIEVGTPVALGEDIGNSASTLKIGARGDLSYWGNGTIDEVRIYNRALNETEISRLYKMSQPKMLAPSNNGLVGYWSFEENTGTKVGDMSGQGNSCTLGAGMTQGDWVNGKFGKALEFDGDANDRVDCGATPTNLIEGASEATLSFWAKRSAPNNPVSVAARSWPNSFSASFWSDGLVYLNVSTGSCVSAYAYFAQNDTNWHHVVMVFNGNLTGDSEKLKGYVDGAQKSMNFSGSICSALSSTLPDLYIGYDNDQNAFSQGIIDEVRIYNRALETNEITALYNSSAVKFNSSQNTQLTNGLVGLWSFNGPDMDGDTAIDRSGSGNNGTITGATKTIGKVGQALSFNGTSDYVNLGESQWDGSWMNHTITVWIRWEGKGPSTVDYLMGKGSGGPNGFSYDISQGPGGLGTVEFRMNSTPRSATTTIKPNDGNWHFLAVALNSSNIYFYLDGNADGSNTHSYAGDNDWSMLIGGIDTGSPPYSPFKGKIDEVRLYNRALTAQEVQRLYNLGR